MGLDLNQLQIGAMAAAAGNNIGNLNLPVADWGAARRNAQEAMVEQQKLQLAYAQMANQQAMQQQGIAGEQGLLAQRGQQTSDLQQASQLFQGGQSGADREQQMQQFQAEQAFKQQQLAQQGQHQQGQLALGQDQLGVDRDRLAQDARLRQQEMSAAREQMEQDQMFKTVKAMSEMKQEERNRIGAFGATVSLLAKTNPAVVGTALDYGVQSGLINADMAEQLKQLPSDQQQAAGAMYASLSDHAHDYAKMMQPSNKAANGTNISFDEQGNVKEISIGAESKVQAAAQQQVVDTLKNLDSLESIVKDFDPKFLTVKGKITSVAGDTLSWLDLGQQKEDVIKQMTGGAVDPAMAKKFTTDYYKFTGQVATFKMNFIKSMSGLSYTDKQMTAMEDAVMTEKDSPAAFYGKAQALTAMMRATMRTQQEVAADKIPMNTPEFQKSFNDRLENNITKELEAKKIPGVMIDGDWLTSDQIKEFAKDAGLSVHEVLKRKGVFQ